MPLVLDGSGGISGVDGTASNPAIEGTDSNTGIFYPAADTVAIGTGGTEALRVNSSQNVGIGTTNPLFKLVVSKAGAEGIEFVPGGTSNVSTTQYYNRSGAVYTANAQDASFHSWLISGTERARITSGGDFQFNSGYGSVATAYGCRAWVNFNGTGTVAIRASGNVTSITDNGTGSYTVNFTTTMPDRNYAVVQCAGNVSTNACYLTSFYTPATGSVRLLCRSDAATTIDADECNIAIFR